MTERSTDQGVTRRVIFQAWCRRCGWKGDERTYKGDASYDLANHNTSRHGGTPRLTLVPNP